MTHRNPPLSIRPLSRADLPAALAIQSEAYPPFLVEGPDAFASRLDLPGTYCLAATRDDALVAYLLAHRWKQHTPPPVGAILSEEPDGEILFIHDLAVSPALRGSGVGRDLVMRAFELAVRNGLRTAELIAVEGAAGYWRALGFADPDVSVELASKVAAYGPEARWMTRGMPRLGA